jgi:hypothetical protein
MKRLTRRAADAQAARRREALPTRHYAEQTTPGFVPPTPAQADRNAILADLNKAAGEEAKEAAKADRVRDLGDRIGLLLALRTRNAELPGVHRDDRVSVIDETLTTTEDVSVLPQVLAQVAGSTPASGMRGRRRSVLPSR